MMKNYRIIMLSVCAGALMSLPIHAQQILTLDGCREMAVTSNSEMEAAQTKIEMSRLDKKIALANYFPNISAKGAYMYNEKNLSIITDETSNQLQNAGTIMHDAIEGKIDSKLLEDLFNKISQLDIAGNINEIGSSLDAALHPDFHNIVVGAISVQQPVFMGGKIVAANKIAELAEQLSRSQYDQKYQEIIVGVDQSYWQIVSISNKLKLAEAYSDLLHKLEHDVEMSMAAGVMTKTDLLEIQVKVNEADMIKLKAENGLTLSKMLLCKQIGLPLNSDIKLIDENLEDIPMPEVLGAKDIEAIWADRPEIRSLQLASNIYDKKVAVVRADMMPQVAVMANYMMVYPNIYNGFEKKVGGSFNVGVMVNIPIFHACEKLNKTRKAKAEASLYRIQLGDAKDMVNLQVTQLRKQQGETVEKLNMARSNMLNAEENLRTASVGFEAGVVPVNTAIAAHTAWLQAHSDYIDAGIELQMNHVNLMKAEGDYVDSAINE